MASIDLGMVTAYAYAVAGGYTGSEQDFEDLLGNIASDLEEIENLSVTVTTLPEGSQATASYNNGVLSLGIPKGDTGATGAEGPEGPTGPTGNGISGIEKTGTSGNVDTYTITYTNGQTTTFTVTNGAVTSVDGQTGDVDLSNKANIDGYYEDLTAGYAENLISNVYDEENVPYNFRTAGGSLDIGSFEYDEVVGGTVAVNQLVNIANGTKTDCGITATINSTTGLITLSGTSTVNYATIFDNFDAVLGHKYIRIFRVVANPNSVPVEIRALNIGWANGYNMVNANETRSTGVGITGFSAGTSLAGITLYANIFDLTQMFGTTIADYIYTLETGNAGAGVAWFKKLFPKSYYPYNTGELMHVQTSGHKMVGFNQWDEEWEVGTINNSTGEPQTNANYFRTKNFIPVFPSTTYYFKSADYLYVYGYDASKNFIGLLYSSIKDTTKTLPNDCCFIKFVDIARNAYQNDICINLHWDGERDGEYEAYTAHTYPLDSDLVLRGIPKLDSANKLYYDGDTYASDGTVTRKYGIVDLGTLTWTLRNDNTTRQAWNVTISDLKTLSTTSEVPGVVCSKFVAVSNSDTWLPGVIASGGANSTTLVACVSPNAYADATAFKTAMSGVYLVYELATPTTETADIFQSPQSVSNWGTEEYIDTRSIPIPVGHNTKYPPDLKAKLETSPNPPDADGDYIVRQTNGVNEYVALSTNATIQNIISRLEALEG